MTPVPAFRTANSAQDLRPGNPARAAFARLTDLSREFALDLKLSIHTRFETVENDWRAFEQIAECTPFQTFEWLRTWYRHIGQRDGVVPVIVVGRFGEDATAFIAPLAVGPGRLARRLCWLGQKLCDYNAPLLAPNFSERVTPDRFLMLWSELGARLQSDPDLRYDWIEFEKMPQTIGVQTNPFVHLAVIPNADSAHIARLGDDWQTFYRTRRSAATRRRDRTKGKRLSGFGDIRFVTAADANDARRTCETLMTQKQRSLARKGIANMFARPGYRQFFLDLASNPKMQDFVHVSRLEIGSSWAATNFGIVFDDCYYHVLASYQDGELSRYGPGALHLRELLAHATARGLQRFDFTIGDEQYKLEWSDVRLPLFDYSTAANWRGWPLRLWSIMRRRLKRVIKQTPAVWRLVRRIRSAVGPF